MNIRIIKLEESILKARKDYYNGESLISDKLYDALIDELYLLDPKNSAVIGIGSDPVSNWEKISHKIPMGSLNKCNTDEEYLKWHNKYISKNEKVILTLKLDGLSASLVYKDGLLVSGATRGSGVAGELITQNIIKMNGVPLRLKEKIDITVRGEIILSKENYKNFFSGYSNPRNAASGISRRYDGEGSDKMSLLTYQLFNILTKLGFLTPTFIVCDSSTEVCDLKQKYQTSLRDKFEFELDGLVAHNNDLVKQELYGSLNGKPYASIALKFENEARESTVRDIHWRVGNSGRLTPVATVDPVMLVGAQVSRASLYNMAYINQLGVDIGATVLVARANDVIPRIEEVIKSTGTVSKPPKVCPECAGKVELRGENLMCTNSIKCPAQVVGMIKNWVSELNLLEWGEALLDRLVQLGKVKTIVDLYTLSVDDLASIDRMGQKSAKKCYDILHSNKDMPLEIFLGGLSIPMIGASSIKLIMGHGCSDLQTFFTKNATDFEQVAGVGPVKAASLRTGLQDNKELISGLLKAGITIKKKVKGKLSNKSICFTGAMVNKRPVLEKMAADAGADVKNTVSKGLSMLVISDPNSQSSKAVGARKLGVQLISEEDFIHIIA